MDDKLNEDVNQLQTIKGIFQDNPIAIGKINRMGVHKTELDNKLDAIKAQAQKTGISVHGLYVVKSSSKESLILILEGGMAAINSHAYEIGDNELFASSKFKAYQLERLHKNDLITKSSIFLEIATNLGAAVLEPHGFDAADLTLWQNTHTAFENAAEAPSVGVETHKTDLSNLKKMVADDLRWLKVVVDTTAIGYKRKDPSFYKLYTFAREKHHQGHRHRKKGEEVITSPGEYVLDILKGGKIAIVGFPILVDKTYLVENTKEAALRYWNQASDVAPETVPESAAILAIGGELENTGIQLGAPAKPFMFFANESLTEDGQVAINIVEGS
ncbi:MAG: hypothetical protein WCH34_06610 [Bacteroidota bacterium]